MLLSTALVAAYLPTTVAYCTSVLHLPVLLLLKALHKPEV
jgi:hypothetical protein